MNREVILSERSESKEPYSCKNHSAAISHGNKSGIAGGHRGPSTPRSNTPPQAQTRCLLGTPFALVAQDDRLKSFSSLWAGRAHVTLRMAPARIACGRE